MSHVAKATLVLVAIAWIGGASWTLPANPGRQRNIGLSLQARAVELRSASGKITSVSRNSFTLKTTQSNQENPGEGFLLGQQPETILTFLTDQRTAIDGKLQVGKTADVAYRQDASGNNVAVSVQVTPES